MMLSEGAMEGFGLGLPYQQKEASPYFIDRRLQEVLGQFRNEFLGEVSAEILGPKFGIYGSFLPVYKRQPAGQISDAKHINNVKVTNDEPSRRIGIPTKVKICKNKGSTPACSDVCYEKKAHNPKAVEKSVFRRNLRSPDIALNKNGLKINDAKRDINKDRSTKKRKILQKSIDSMEKKPKISTSLSVKDIRCDSFVESVSPTSILSKAALGVDTLKSPKSTKKPEKQSENQPRISSSDEDAASIMTEAGNFKRLADRLMNSGSNVESQYLYFEAALKLLHGAYLLESGSRDTAMEVYKSTAELCEFCALEYEKSEDFAASALVYKIIEVAYMRVIHSSNTDANKNRQELEKTLQEASLGESPSSVDSDLINTTTVDKAYLVQGVGAARDCPNLARLLNFAENVNKAMEASRRCRGAYEAAGRREGINLVQNAINYNFQDLERFLKLIRLAMDAISP